MLFKKACKSAEEIILILYCRIYTCPSISYSFLLVASMSVDFFHYGKVKMFICIVTNVTFLLLWKNTNFWRPEPNFTECVTDLFTHKTGLSQQEWDKWKAYPFIIWHKTAGIIKSIAEIIKEDKAGMLRTKHRGINSCLNKGFPECI